MKNIIKTKKIKLFKKGEELIVSRDMTTDYVSIIVKDKKGKSEFTHEDANFYINYCKECGNMFVTKEKVDLCIHCKLAKDAITEIGNFSIEKLLEIIKKKDAPKTKKKDATTTTDKRKIKDPKKYGKKYYDYCNMVSNLVTPKDFNKYVENGKKRTKFVQNEYLTKAFFHLVYKGSTTQAIASTFDISVNSAVRNLNHMAAMGLVFYDKIKNKYRVMPSVEVTVK